MSTFISTRAYLASLLKNIHLYGALKSVKKSDINLLELQNPFYPVRHLMVISLVRLLETQERLNVA